MTLCLRASKRGSKNKAKAPYFGALVFRVGIWAYNETPYRKNLMITTSAKIAFGATVGVYFGTLTTAFISGIIIGIANEVSSEEE